MPKQHLKRYLIPKYWKLPKKGMKLTVRPRAGPHKLTESIPLQIIVRDILKLVDTGKYSKKIIKAGEILVDGKVRKDHKFPVGLMDVIEISKIKKYYRMLVNKDGLILNEIPAKEAKMKLCKINNITLLKGKKIQLNLHDGRNLLADETKKTYKTGDSILIEIPSQKIVDHIKLDKGNLCLVTGGQNKGYIATAKELIITRSREPNKLILKKEHTEFEAIKDYVFPIGTEKPLIKISSERI